MGKIRNDEELCELLCCLYLAKGKFYEAEPFLTCIEYVMGNAELEDVLDLIKEANKDSVGARLQELEHMLAKLQKNVSLVTMEQLDNPEA